VARAPLPDNRGVDVLALQGEHAEDALADAAERRASVVTVTALG